MDEQRVHLLAAEVGEALKRLEQFRDAISGLAAGMAAVQVDMTGLDTQIRLIAEAGALRREAAGEPETGVRPSDETDGAGHAMPASHVMPAGHAVPAGQDHPSAMQESGAVPAWFAQTWQGLVRQVAEVAAAAEAAAEEEAGSGAESGTRAGAETDAQADPEAGPDDQTQLLHRLSALHPLLERLAVLFRRLSAGEGTDLAPLTEQFGQMLQQFESLAVGLSEAAALTQAPAQAAEAPTRTGAQLLAEAPWQVAIDLPRLAPADYVNLVTQEDGLVPQINLSVVVAAVEEEVNHALRRWFQARRAIRLKVRQAGSAGAWEAEWHRLVDGLIGLQERAAEFVRARQESGGPVPEPLAEMQRLLADALRQMAPAVQPGPTRSSRQRRS